MDKLGGTGLDLLLNQARDAYGNSGTDASQLSALKEAGKSGDTPEDIENAASQFESLLVNQMLKSMWSTVNTEGLLGEDSNQAKIYRDMFNQALADEISVGRGIGVKSYLSKELTKAK